MLGHQQKNLFVALSYEPLPGLTRSLYQGLRAAMGTHEVGRLRRLLSVFKSFSITVDPSGAYTFGMDVDTARGHADSGDASSDLTDLLRELGSTARELGVGALLVVDELQDTPAIELAALNRAIHDAGQGDEPLPILLMGAGLPSLPGILADATSHAERLYKYRSVGPLGTQAAERALRRPAESLGVSWSADALSEQGDGTQVAVADLAREMGMRRSTDLSVSRDQLIKKGLVYAPNRGLLASTVPGMADYIGRQPDE